MFSYTHIDMSLVVEKVHYAMAHIHIPMIRKPDGSFDSLTEYITVDLEKINEIPSKPPVKMNNAYIKTKMDEMFSIPLPKQEEVSVQIPEPLPPPPEPLPDYEKMAVDKFRILTNKTLAAESEGKKKKKLKTRPPSPDFKIKS